MKTFISVTFMITGLIILAQPVRGHPRGDGGGFSGGGTHFPGGGSHFSIGAPRFVGENTHFSSVEVRPLSAFRPHTFAGTGSRIISRTSRANVSFETSNHLGDRFGTLKNPRTMASASRRFDRQGFDGRNHIFARAPANWHRDWDRHRDHFWLRHRCRFFNGTWIIFDEGLYPDDFYPDDYSYDNYDAPSVYASSSYESRGSDSIVLEVQVALQKAGYDPGSTDGVFGHNTREAISRYQRDQGLDATGSITDPVLQALRLVEVN